jgi:hypothetical protein
MPISTAVRTRKSSLAKGVHVKLHGVLLLLATAARADHPMILAKSSK